MTKIKYGILLPNGELARVRTADTSDRDNCNASEHVLTNDNRWPEWLTDDPEVAAEAVFDDPHWYNSTHKRPAWGDYSDVQLRIARVEIDISEATDIKVPANIQCVQCHDISWDMAKQYAPNVPDNSILRYVWCLVIGKLEDYLPLVGTRGRFGSVHLKRDIIAAVPTPQGWVAEAEEDIKRRKRSHKHVPDGHCLLICVPVND